MEYLYKRMAYMAYMASMASIYPSKHTGMKHTCTLPSPFLLPFLAPIILAGVLSDASCSPLQSAYVVAQCRTTLYPDVCIRSLSKYAELIMSNPKLLANTAMAFTFNSTRDTLSMLRNMQSNPQGSKSLGECVEVVSEALDNLQRSMRRIDKMDSSWEFESAINDIQTWVSAALTDDDTCMEDFPGTATPAAKATVGGQVTRIAHLTSIALVFINRYAAD